MIFIIGVLPENSGKTTLATALVSALKDLGIKISAFKPISGHSMWWQFSSYKMCLKYGSLFCEDAFKFWKLLQQSIPIEIINPVDVLFSMPDVNHSSPSLIRFFFGNENYDWFAMGRFTVVEEKPKHIIYFKKDPSAPVIMPNDLLKIVKSKADEVVEVKNIHEYLNLHQKYCERAISTCYDFLNRISDEIIVESFNDAVYPWRGVEHSEVVLAIAPAHVLIYDPKSFFKTVRKFKDPYTKTYQDVYSFIKPLEILKLPPLTQSELLNEDIVKARYSEAIHKIINQISAGR